MQEDTEEKQVTEEPEDYSALSEDEILERVERLIEEGNLDGAQRAIDYIKQKSAKKYYLQSKIYAGKGWFNEQRKQLKAAIKADPENAEYKQALQELEAFRKSGEYKTVRKQMGGKEGLAECCVLCSCECCLEGLCESICEGCG